MHFIDPHIHIASRTTDDLQAMAAAGCLVVGEPAFLMGYDRSGTDSFYDYFRQLTEWEPKRAANYGIQHYARMGINAKEAENVSFAKDVIVCCPSSSIGPTFWASARSDCTRTRKRGAHAAGTYQLGRQTQ